METPGSDARGVSAALVGDELMVLEAMAGLMVGGPVTVHGVACSTDAAIAVVRTHGPDVVVLDGGMTMINCERLADLRRTHPALRALLLAARPDVDDVQKAIAAGFQGLVDKNLTMADLRRAIVDVGQGRQFFDPTVLVQLLVAKQQLGAGDVHSPTVDADDALPALSDREIEILDMLASDHGTREIATALFLSVHTVRNHIRRIMGKLDVHSRARAVAVAMEMGMIGTRAA